MTYDEFVYQHDLDLVYELLNQYVKFNQQTAEPEKVKEVSGKEFFV